jgi:hypothetical protein
LKKVFVLFGFLLLSYTGYGQHKDYANIKFKSKVRYYSKTIPKVAENGIEKEDVKRLIALLGEGVLNEKQETELFNKIWLALSNPEKFDFVYKDYSIKTIDNWGVKIKFEDPNFEPNPYLYQWTITADEFTYFQWTLTRILTYEGLIAYGDEAKKAGKSIRNLLLTKKINFPPPAYEDHTYSYLERMNKLVSSKGYALMVYEYHFDFLACKKENQEGISEILEKFRWHFVPPKGSIEK